MSNIGIRSVKVGKGNDRKVKANERIPFIFTFTRPLQEGETLEIECHLFEKQFDLNRTVGTFTLSSKPPQTSKWVILDEPPACDSNPIHITLPEEMAGATVNIHFALKLNIKKGAPLINPLFQCQEVTLDITSSEGSPKIEAIHWSNSKEIRFGKLSAARTHALVKNETVYLHIHTRGLYGKQVVCKRLDSPDPFSRTALMKDNIAVLEYTFKDDASNQIQLIGYPFTFSLMAGKTVTIPYVHNEELVIATRTLPVYAYPNTPKHKDYASQAKCRVDFRPMPNYDGSFGFSWYRMDDMNETTGYKSYTHTYARTKQLIIVNTPCNDQPFSERDFPTTGILGRHYETVGERGHRRNQIVGDQNNSGTGYGSGVDYTGVGVRDNFVADPVMADDHKKDYPKITLLGFSDAEPLMQEYLAPVMTLACGKKAQLRLFLYVKESPQEILFAFDNPRAETEGIFSIQVNPKPIATPPMKRPDYTYDIEITCHKKFDKELRLKAYAVPKGAKAGMVKKENGRLVIYPEEGQPLVLPELCGMLRILPNDDAHWREIEVVFFNVKTKLNKMEPTMGGLTYPKNDAKEPLKAETGTASSTNEHPPLLSPEVPPAAPPIVILPPFPSTASIQIKGGSEQEKTINKFLAQAYVKAKIITQEIDLSNDSAYENLCVDKNSDGVLDGLDYEQHRFNLVDLLLAHPLSTRYGALNYFRLYFMPDEAIKRTPNGYSNIVGFSDADKNFTICFHKANNSTPVHELGHTLGLPHTFCGNTDQGARYSYEDGKTDNIMDYSSHFYEQKEGEHVYFERQSFFHWQWEVLNTNLNK